MAQINNAATPITPIQPLMQQFPIVDSTTGKPSDYFMRYILNHSGQITTNTNDLSTIEQEIATLETAKVLGTAGEILVTPSSGLIIDNPVLSLADTTVTPGSYTNSNITVDQFGRITAAANGSGGGGGGGSQSAIVSLDYTVPGYIAKGYNIASVTRTAQGRYRITFTTAMPDINYTVSGVGQWSNPYPNGDGFVVMLDRNGSRTINYCDIVIVNLTVAVMEDPNTGYIVGPVVVAFQSFSTTSGFG